MLKKLATGQLSGMFTDVPLYSTPNSPVQTKSGHPILESIDLLNLVGEMGVYKP